MAITLKKTFPLFSSAPPLGEEAHNNMKMYTVRFDALRVGMMFAMKIKTALSVICFLSILVWNTNKLLVL